MFQTFDHAGVSFRYPAGWELEHEDGDDGWSVALHSPGTAFVLLRCDGSMPTIEDQASAALETLQSDYPELEAEPSVERVAGQTAVGHDIQFFHFDLTNTCWTRSFYSEAGTVLLLCQTSDVEADAYLPILRAISASIAVAGP